MTKRFLLGSCLVFSLINLTGQEMRLFVNRPFITTEDPLQLILLVYDNPLVVKPEFPVLGDFRKGGMEMRPTTRSQRKEIQYVQTYFPLKKGKFIIPSFEVKTSEGIHRTRTLTVEVEDPSVKFQYTDRSFPVEAEFRLDKSEVWSGEQVRAELIVKVPAASRKYIDIQAVSAEDVTGLLDTSQFSFVTEVKDPPEEIIVGETGGQLVEFHLLDMWLFPDRAGKVEFPALPVYFQRQQIAMNIPRGGGGALVRFRTDTVRTSAHTLNIRPLPPSGLKKAGNVGQFTLTHQIDSDTLMTGESAILSLYIEGTGNMALLPRPRLKRRENLLYFEPVTGRTAFKKNGHLVGTKPFFYEIIPAKPGYYNLGPVIFYYFNAEKAAYDSLEILSIPLLVEGKEIPQLLEVNAVNDFYLGNLSEGEIQAVRIFSGWPYIIISCLLVVIFSWGIFFRRNM